MAAHCGQRGAFSIELTALFSIVIAALLSMSVYMLRAVNGKWREVGDEFGQGRQYEHCKTRVFRNGVQVVEPGCSP